MAGLPPLRNLRKTTIVVIVVFIAFFIHRIVLLQLDDFSYQDLMEPTLTPAQSVVCRNVVRGTPFGVDSVFDESIRLYFYSTISKPSDYAEDTLRHIWFLGTDTIQIQICDLRSTESLLHVANQEDAPLQRKNICYSEVSPKLLKPGEWSVDLVAGRKLLSSKQFVIEASGR